MKKIISLGIILFLFAVTFVTAEQMCDPFYDQETPYGGGGDQRCDSGEPPMPPIPPAEIPTLDCVGNCYQTDWECNCGDETISAGNYCYGDSSGEFHIENTQKSCWEAYLADGGVFDTDEDNDNYWNFEHIKTAPRYQDLYDNNVYFMEKMIALENDYININTKIHSNDCDDQNPDVNPEAEENDETTDIDENCDGLTTTPDYSDIKTETALLPTVENGEPKYYICGGSDVELLDIVADTTYEIKDVCDQVEITTGPTTKTLECAPISNSETSFYRWVEISPGEEYLNIYPEVLFIGDITETTKTYGTDGRIYYIDDDGEITEEKTNEKYRVPQMQCANGQLREVFGDFIFANIEVIQPVDTTKDDLAAGIQQNVLEIKSSINNGASNLPVKKTTVLITNPNTGEEFTTAIVCDNENAETTSEGEPCLDDGYCPDDGTGNDYICEGANENTQPPTLGECVIDGEPTGEVIPECSTEGNSRMFFLPKGSFEFEYTFERDGEDDEQYRFAVKIDTDGQYSPGYDEQGACAQDDQCFLKYEDGVAVCVDNQYYEKDDICLAWEDDEQEWHAEWATRAGVLATTMKAFAEEQNKPYTIDCNNKDESVNEYMPSGEETHFCVLNIYDGEDVEQTIIGIGLENHVMEEGNPIVDVFREMGIGDTNDGFVKDCEDVDVDSTAGEFIPCQHREIWYYPEVKLVLFSKTTINLDNTNLWQGVLNWFNELFGRDPNGFDVLGLDGEPISRKANKIYYAENPTTENYIYAGIEYMNYEDSGIQETLAIIVGKRDLCATFESLLNPDDVFECQWDDNNEKTVLLARDFDDEMLKTLTVPIQIFR